MDPDDLVQEALVQTLRRHDLSEIEFPLAYLKRAIVNSVSNGRRRASRFGALRHRLLSTDSAVDAYPSDLAILDGLSVLDRSVVFLADVEGLPHEVIAAELGITATAVRKRASRARRQLRDLLGVDLRSVPSVRPTDLPTPPVNAETREA